MKPAEIHVTTRVLPGHRIEITAPELEEGQNVELTIRVPPPSSADTPRSGLLDFLDSLPPSTRTPEEWEAYEKEFKRERDSWDR